jgi:Galactose oxidase, central domain
MKIELKPEKTSLTIGDEFTEKNEIAFTITLTGDDAAWLTLQIPVGNDGVLQQREDANNIVVATPGTEPQPRPGEYVNDKKEWYLGNEATGVSVNGSTQVSVSIKNILCRASVGTSKLTISGATEPDPVPHACTLEITKAKPSEAPKSLILYFTAEPAFLMAPGEVKVMWEVFDRQQVTLKTPSGGEPPNPSSPYQERLDKTGAYTLRVGNESKQFTVNVLTKGWHQLDDVLNRSAFPSVIFDQGGTRDFLYGIFVSRKNKSDPHALLCKSANGITGWQVINSDVPKGMESSPGLLLQNRLWLIGGSAVDPDRKSNSIWYIDLDRDKLKSGWKKANLVGAEADKFEMRMGHACVILDDATFWVLGGLGRYRCLSDVWSFEIAGDKLRASRFLQSSKWGPRCMFSAVKHKELIWVCGGVDSPNGNPLGDLWTIAWKKLNEKDWTERRRGRDGKDHVIAGAIGTGATCVGDKLTTVFTSRRAGATRKTAGKMIRLERAAPEGDDWVTEPSGPRGPAWTIDPHGITAVSFQGRLYLRYLHRDVLQPGNQAMAPLYVYIF